MSCIPAEIPPIRVEGQAQPGGAGERIAPHGLDEQTQSLGAPDGLGPVSDL